MKLTGPKCTNRINTLQLNISNNKTEITIIYNNNELVVTHLFRVQLPKN